MKRLTALAVVLMMSACDAFMEPSPTAPEPGPPEPALRPGPNSDWPDPVRVEPEQGAVVDPPEGAVVPLADDGKFTDFVGDVGEGPAWLDITDVAFGLQSLDGCCVAVAFDLAEPFPDPAPHRGDQWIAYGLVLDVDGDGTADVRIGMDNLSNRGGHRAWRTDLTTAVTFYQEGPPYGGVGETVLDSWYPGDHIHRHGDGYLVVDQLPGETEFRFYVWASLIEGGQVVATDYAPDNGWLNATP